MEDRILFSLLECPKTITEILEEIKLREIQHNELERFSSNWYRKGSSSGYIAKLKGKTLIHRKHGKYEINWDAFLRKWRRTLIQRGINPYFHKFDINQLRNTIDNDEIRKCIFSTYEWNDILFLDKQENLPMSIYGFFSIALFTTYLVGGRDRKLMKKDHEYESYHLDGFEGKIEDAFYFIGHHIWKRVKGFVNRDEFDARISKLYNMWYKSETLIFEEFDSANWFMHVAMSMPEELRNEGESWFESLHRVFTKGDDRTVIKNEYIATTPYTARDIVENYELLERISDICFS